MERKVSAAVIIYLADTLQTLDNVSQWGLFISFILIFILLLFQGMSLNEFKPFEYAKPKYFIISISIFTLLTIIIPSSKTIYQMAGAKLTQDVVESPEAKEISSKLLQIINQKLDEQIKETK